MNGVLTCSMDGSIEQPQKKRRRWPDESPSKVARRLADEAGSPCERCQTNDNLCIVWKHSGTAEPEVGMGPYLVSSHRWTCCHQLDHHPCYVSSHRDPIAVQCDCHQPARLRRCQSGNSVGRYIFCCNHPDRNCSFVRWAGVDPYWTRIDQILSDDLSAEDTALQKLIIHGLCKLVDGSLGSRQAIITVKGFARRLGTDRSTRVLREVLERTLTDHPLLRRTVQLKDDLILLEDLETYFSI